MAEKKKTPAKAKPKHEKSCFGSYPTAKNPGPECRACPFHVDCKQASK